MPRGDQLSRQWKIIQSILSSNTGKTAKELADETESNLRTVYRDLEALQTAGFPIYTENIGGRNVWTVLNKMQHQLPLPLTFTELMALYFSLDMMKILHDTVFYDSLDSLFQKIRAMLPSESLSFLQNVQQTLYVTQRQYKKYSKYRQTLSGLNSAALQKKSVVIDYFSMSGKEKTARSVDPYRIWYFNGTFYLVGYCHLRQEIRIFAVDRIKKLQVTEKSFTVPEDFDIEELMSGSLGAFHGAPQRVRIVFDRDVAGYVGEKVWHESQTLLPQDDGSLVFEANVAVNPDLKSWILSWGAKARVLEPDSLRQEMAEETAALARQYAEG